MSELDLYSILGVSRNASQEEIKRAYRKLARQYHPDHNPGDPDCEERFKQATMAYEILCDPVKRAQYDQFGTARPGAGAGFTDFGSVADLFEFFFGHGFGDPFGARQRTRRDPAYADGRDIVETVTLELADTLKDRDVKVKVRRLESCPRCRGSCTEPGTNPTVCPQCGGRGVIAQTRQSLLGVFTTTSTCSRCRGSGRIIEVPCEECHGSGVKAADRTIEVTVPAGISDGTVLRLASNGNAGTGGGRAGDILLRVRVKPHPVFIADGADLYAELPVSFTELVLGGEVIVRDLAGEELRVRVPPGTEPGEVLILRNRGLSRLNGHGYGDLHLRVALDLPKKLSREERRLLNELAAANGKRGLHAEGPRPLRKLRNQ